MTMSSHKITADAETVKTRHQRRVSKNRQKLLEAARGVFAEKGLDLTRIDEITDRADLGKGTFYNHFKSKEELIQVLIKTITEDLVSELKTKCKDIDDLAILVDRLIGVHIDFFSRRWEDFVLYFQGRADLKLEKGYDGIDKPYLKYLDSIGSLLNSVVNRPLSKTELRRIACAVTGFVSGYYSFAVISSVDDDIETTFKSVRGSMVESLVRFVNNTIVTSANG